jgi:5,6-dimethylbenzimidazole synthase
LSTPPADLAPAPLVRPNRKIVDKRRYESLIDVLQRRGTARRFAADSAVTEEDCLLILEAARLAPSGANAQPWQFVVVRSGEAKGLIAGALAQEQAARAAAAGAAPAIDYQPLAAAPGMIVVAGDFRLSWVFSGLMAGTELDQRFHANAERIILQSLAAATMTAHLAAAALGFQSWWISVLGEDETQTAIRSLLGIPADLTVTDIMAFGHAAGPLPRRWKKATADIASWDRFDMTNFRSVGQIDAWMADLRRDPPIRKLK